MTAASRALLALAAGLLLASVVPAPASQALGISPNPFVVPNFDDTEHGSIELVAVVSGVPSGGTVLSGTVDPGDVTLVLRADVTSGDSDLLSFAIGPVGGGGPFVPLAGIGWVAGGGRDVVFGGSGVPGTTSFAPVGGPVLAGQSYDLVFLSYDSAPAGDGSLEIVGGLLLVPEVVGTATLVPEPASALLLGAGIALLGRLRLRARA